MNIELYIADRLCDLDKPDLSIRLKRQFINPTELNTKDAQKSYSITLPSTPINDEIFKYSNVEETENKFSLYPDAKLYINGILILEGKFRLTEITRDSYRGNLGVPAPLTAKDIFGERKMNEIGEWNLTDWDRQPSISRINNEKNPPVMFPFVMHSLFPKSSPNKEPTGKDVYDSTAKLMLDNCPPSFNCINMFQQIFSNLGYNLSGSATTDERLKNLYVSHKNPNDKRIDWGISDGITVQGKWNLVSNDGTVEKKFGLNQSNTVCGFNIFEGSNNVIEEGNLSDTQGWMTKKDTGGFYIKIPRSALYKISFNVAYHMDEYKEYHASGFTIVSKTLEKHDAISSEIYLTRNRKTDLDKIEMSNTYTINAINQNPSLDTAIFNQENRVHFIDPAQTPFLLSGFSFGKFGVHDQEGNQEYLDNPMVSSSRSNPIAIKGGKSWNKGTEFIYSAVDSPSYVNREWHLNSEFLIELEKSETKTWQSRYEGRDYYRDANGTINQVVWLEKDDEIGMIDVSSARYNNNRYEVPLHNINYNFSIKPFRNDKEWITINDQGASTAPMNWNDTPNYYDTELDLTQFLPSESTINDWINNFCKAFNLRLTHVGDKKFSLDIKDTSLLRNTSLVIDLDKKTNVSQRQNEPLNLPRAYELGFSINNSEHGYLLHSLKDSDNNIIPNTGTTGGGTFYTNNNVDSNTIKQNSNFSYCWYKPIKMEGSSEVDIPVITDHEIWGKGSDYAEMEKKKYFNLAQRFWYKKDEVREIKIEDQLTDLAMVTNKYQGEKSLELSYEDKPDSIMRNFFMLLTNEKNYTVVECYLTPEEYNDLDKALIRFNGDMYIVAEADGYDPMATSKTKLKLIKKM